MKRIFSLLPVVMLAACAPPEQASAPAPATPSAPAAVAAAPDFSMFNTLPTIRDVMNTLIDPSADELWNSVRFEVDETGSHEYRPETDEEWAALRYEAISIIEGGNALMIPGRRVAAPGASTEFPDFEYRPDEVQAKLDEDRIAWDGFAQGLQAAAVQIIEAIDARDVDLFSEYGAQLDAACESCHEQYWYRPGTGAPQ